VTRRALSLAVAVVLLFLAVSTAPAADPIRIGFLAPMTGLFAQAGKDMLDGLKMGLEATGGQVAGRKLELIEAP
jgi:branched-chain amino acid transport system substrate-binding protein